MGNVMYLCCKLYWKKKKNDLWADLASILLFANFCSNYYGTLEYKGHSDFNVMPRPLITCYLANTTAFIV